MIRASDISTLAHSFRTLSPLALLITMNLAMTLSFATWQLLINNFAHQEVGFDGAQYGELQSLREIPGFLAFLVVYLLLFVRERVLALFSLVLLAFATAMTGFLPSYAGLMITTLISSIGFHYYETINQSLQLQWLPKEDAPRLLGLILGASSALTFIIFAAITFLWEPLGFDYQGVFLSVGLGSLVLIGVAALHPLPRIAEHKQHAGIVLRKRYWLFYLLQFLSGARRQIFVVFSGFMMVERFGFSVPQISALMLATFLLSTILTPLIGRMIGLIGERRALIIEYSGLLFVFLSYAGIYVFDWPAQIGAALYLIDHIFFAMAIAMKTYFQKIADPRDIASSAAISFTINHIAAVFLPILLGLIWVIAPAYVFGLAALLAFCSLLASLLVPHKPEPGSEVARVFVS